MEGVAKKVRRDVHLRVGKPIPYPGWRIRRGLADVISEIIGPIKEQLEEDATWKE